eukprot:CAMPEP_0179693554 /NCGR_PEP_ID=MMETSP0936-20121108/5321_1 /TAXON_ID=548131 ORGANISM="Ostreococcus mediterraneus, Strain clade-D-RCC2573" /NCGR_SAMPLE_ID=MMETSP0936 /ASSEMBLY_ACC=CAM_ASM_000574 /LENGTH=83 /DNA_ID=CAMNT_0021566295 /DNA_START=1051 /DNA_END=1302 /DNA_ORIENTATION=+
MTFPGVKPLISAGSSSFGIIPSTVPPLVWTAEETLPISPTDPPPYTKPKFLRAISTPRASAASEYSCKKPFEAPQYTHIVFIN